MKLETLANALLSTSAFVMLGIMMFAITFFVITKMAPFSMKKEIAEDQNVALAVLIAAVIIGISLIIAAGIHG